MRKFLPSPTKLDIKKEGVINPENEIDEECFKWSVIAALHNAEIRSHPESILNLTRFENNHDWSGLAFPLSSKGISEFGKKNNVMVNVLGVERKKVHILRGKKYDYRMKVTNLLRIAEGECRHCTAIKSLTSLLASSNSRHGHKQHFCMNCFQGSQLKSAGISILNIVKRTKQ